MIERRVYRASEFARYTPMGQMNEDIKGGLYREEDIVSIQTNNVGELDDKISEVPVKSNGPRPFLGEEIIVYFRSK